MDDIAVVRDTVIRFCEEFIQDPYLCYTEHGQHALFYTMLFNALPESRRYAMWDSKRVCLLQKEYPTAGSLSKSRRQHWDIALLQTPLQPVPGEAPEYDRLKLAAAVEFGMNAKRKHLREDIRRLCHPDAHVGHGFVVHLYRLSPPGEPFSRRDRSASSPRILEVDDVAALPRDPRLEIYYGMVDATGRHEQGLWCIQGNPAEPPYSP
jgi:hypothetical protein